MPINIALAIGFDPWLFESQRTVWRSAGYFVTSTGSIKEAIGHFSNGDFDLVLLDHSISSAARDDLTSLLRRSGSLIPIYCSEDSSDNIYDFRRAVTDGPHALAQWIGGLSATQTRKLPVNASREAEPDTLDDWFYRLRA